MTSMTVIAADVGEVRPNARYFLYVSPGNHRISTEWSGPDNILVKCPPRAIGASLVDALRHPDGQRLMGAVVEHADEIPDPLGYHPAIEALEEYLDRSVVQQCTTRHWLRVASEMSTARDIRVLIDAGDNIEGIAHAWVEEALEGPVGVHLDLAEAIKTIRDLLSQYPEQKGNAS